MPLAAFPKCFMNQLNVTGEMTVDDWIERSRELDVDGLEFYWGFTPWPNRRELHRLREKVEADGRSIPMMCYSPDFTKPSADARREEVERQKNAIRATAHLGGGYCRVLSGQRRPGVSREQGIAWVRNAIHELLPVAEEHDVILTLENHYKDGYWDYPEFAQKQDLFLELLDAVGDHSNFGVNYDPSNALIAGDDPIELLEAVKDRVVTMHASDRYLEGGSLNDLCRMEEEGHQGYADVLEHGVVGDGLNDYDQIFSILSEAGFDGWISIEDGQDPEKGIEHLHASAQFLRSKMSAHGLS